MKLAKRFFKKYLLSTLIILILFFDLNEKLNSSFGPNARVNSI